MKATFYPGSSIRAQDLNDNFEQLQMAIQEAKCDVETLESDVDTNYWNKTTDTIRSTDSWVADDDHVMTTLAGDNRYLSGTPGPGPGVNIVNGQGTSAGTSGIDIKIDVVQSTFWGQKYPSDGIGTGTASTIDGNVTGVGTVQFGTGETYTFPTTDGAVGDVLTTNGSGTLNWVAQSGGGSGTNVVIVANVAALNTAAASLTVDDIGKPYLVQDSTNINTNASPAISGLPVPPDGGWDGTIQTTVQWDGAAWDFVRYSPKVPDDRYVNTAGDTMTGALTLSGAPSANLHAATKKYVDDSVSGVSANNNKITLTAGTGLSGGGDFTLNQNSDKEITFNSTVTAFDGGVVNTSITTPERTIGATWDLSTGPFWTCGKIDVPNPTDAVSGMSGLIRLTDEPNSWGDQIHNGPTAVSSFPAIVPFYVESATSIRMGNAVEVS
jgi:hypothetical protein